jgi:hypothetical protein
MLICRDCGYIFGEDEVDYYEERHGLDYPPYEKVFCCPSCQGDFEEAEYCEVCENYFYDEDVVNGICHECLDKFKQKHKYNILSCLEFTREQKTTISISEFFTNVFSVSEIEEILKRELLVASACAPVDCSDFIEYNSDIFIEKAKEEVKR